MQEERRGGGSPRPGRPLTLPRRPDLPHVPAPRAQTGPARHLQEKPLAKPCPAPSLRTSPAAPPYLASARAPCPPRPRPRLPARRGPGAPPAAGCARPSPVHPYAGTKRGHTVAPSARVPVTQSKHGGGGGEMGRTGVCRDTRTLCASSTQDRPHCPRSAAGTLGCQTDDTRCGHPGQEGLGAGCWGLACGCLWVQGFFGEKMNTF